MVMSICFPLVGPHMNISLSAASYQYGLCSYNIVQMFSLGPRKKFAKKLFSIFIQKDLKLAELISNLSQFQKIEKNSSLGSWIVLRFFNTGRLNILCLFTAL